MKPFKNILLLIFTLLSLSMVKAQTIEVPMGDSVYTFAEQMPEYKGGTDAMNNFIGKNIVYPKRALTNNVQGRVIITFIVGEDGKIRDITQVGKKLGYGCDEEAIRVIEMMPNWEPGRLKGKPVSVKYTIPISFRIK